jgi:alpha-glucosidase (family GH31 glycosyl hydrolase)
MTIKGMMFDSYINWINVQLKTPSNDQFQGIFGLGERANKDFFYKDGVYTIWGSDQGTPDEDGKPPSKAMYGTHPFYMYRHAANSWVGVFYKLAHAQDWWIRNHKETGTIDLTTIATGGVADIYVFVDKQEPSGIIERYYSIIGNPVLIPQWALGWNQCKWGYTSTQDLQDSVDGYKNYSIPLDVQWSDIDYMSNYKDFTYDT